jgi:hypothetical protein
MLGRRVLYYDSDPAADPVAERAIAAAGCEATVLTDGAGLAEVDLAGYDVVVLTLDEAARPHQRAFLERAVALYPRTKLVMQVCDQDLRCIEWMSQRPSLNHVIAKRAEPLDAEELTATLAKLGRGDFFGIDKYLRWGVETYQVPVRDSRDKAQYVREVSALANRLGCSERVVELVETVVDELSTNAIFNAPRNADGEPRYAHLNRREAVALVDHEAASLTFAFDGSYFVVAQRDPFGALSRETVVTYLSRCLKQTPDQQPGAGGAGMGLFRVYRALSKLVFNIGPGKMTEVIGMIDLRQSIKSFKKQPKSLHFFVEEGEL